jgi:hypothetical protein
MMDAQIDRAEVYLAETCRLFVLIALLAAAIGKSANFRRFRDSLGEAFPVLERSNGAMPIAAAILIGEWSAALLILAGGVFSRAGLLLASGLFVFLTAVVALVLAKGLSIRCNCFGASQRRISGYDMVRNVLFIAAAGFGLYGASADGVAGVLGGLTLSAYVPLVAVALMLFQLSIGLREIVHMLRIRAEDL